MKTIQHSIILLIIVSFFLSSCSKDKEEEVVPATISTPLVSDPSLAPFSTQNKLALDSVINYVLVGNSIPGVVVGVRSPTYGTYKNGFGVANYSTQAPMTTDAIFGIGSVHKNFKWVLLHILEKEGVLSLNDLVNTYVTDPVLPGITLRDLCMHSSGLIDIPESTNFNQIWQNGTFENSYDTMMHYLNNSTGSNWYGPFTNGRLQNFTPGTDGSYSSYGPLILGEVVKSITGKNIRQLVHEKIVVPLGLTATTHMAYEPDPVLLAPGHEDSVTVWTYTPTAQSTMGLSSANGGAMHSDVSDLLTFTHNQFTNSNFISQNTISNMTQQYVPGRFKKLGLGVIQFNQWAPSNFWGHAGFGIRAHSTTILHNEMYDLSIVVVTNIQTPMDDHQTNYAISEAILNYLH